LLAGWVLPYAHDFVFIPNSGYLEIISELGIIGLFLFLAVFLIPIRFNLKYRRYIFDKNIKDIGLILALFCFFTLVVYLMRFHQINFAFITLGLLYFFNCEKNPTWDVEHSPWKAKQILKIINDNKLQPHSVGCGAGEILNQLYLQMPKNVSFVGYEISPQAFKLCQQRKKDRIHFYLENLLENKEAFFDLVLVIDVLEHIGDYLDFLEELREKGLYKNIPFSIRPISASCSTEFSNS
jgi:hypothetical protein